MADGPGSTQLERIVAVVDSFLDAVAAASMALPRVPIRDLNDAFLCAAYGRAYRCVRSIRDIAARGEADDALVLLRALVSIVGRSLYVVAPDDPLERKRRLDSSTRSWGEQALRALDDLISWGFDPGDDGDRIAAIADEPKARDVPQLPSDRLLLEGLGLSVYHARIYRLASDAVHYSIGSALDGFLEMPAVSAGGVVALDLTDDERAAEALELAAIMYGEFLERSESVIPHGVTSTALREFDEYHNSKNPSRDEAS